jgi:hypothetical protein
MKVGDLVRVKKSAIDNYSTIWLVEMAERKTPLLLVEQMNIVHWRVLRPNGTSVFLTEAQLTKRMW